MSQNVLQVIFGKRFSFEKKAEMPKHFGSFLGGKRTSFPFVYPFYNNINTVKSTLWLQLYLLFYSHSGFWVWRMK